MKFYFTCICDYGCFINCSRQLHQFKKGDEFWAEVRDSVIETKNGESYFLITKHNRSSRKDDNYYMTANELNKHFNVEVAFS